MIFKNFDNWVTPTTFKCINASKSVARCEPLELRTILKLETPSKINSSRLGTRTHDAKARTDWEKSHKIIKSFDTLGIAIPTPRALNTQKINK